MKFALKRLTLLKVFAPCALVLTFEWNQLCCFHSTHPKDHPVDVFVHELCKLFGRHGVPEYGFVY